MYTAPWLSATPASSAMPRMVTAPHPCTAIDLKVALRILSAVASPLLKGATGRLAVPDLDGVALKFLACIVSQGPPHCLQSGYEMACADRKGNEILAGLSVYRRLDREQFRPLAKRRQFGAVHPLGRIGQRA